MQQVLMNFFATTIRKIRSAFETPEDALRRLGVSVGVRCHIMPGVIADSAHAWLIEIGDDVTIAPRVYLLAHDASTKRLLHYTRIGKIRIGSRVFIGAGSILLPGITVGDDVIVGAGSVVSRDIPAGSVAAGNPAKVLCSINDFVAGRQREFNACPCFGKNFTLDGGITQAMKAEMKRTMVDRIGFVD
jgi:maltose O-acetyltransferase